MSWRRFATVRATEDFPCLADVVVNNEGATGVVRLRHELVWSDLCVYLLERGEDN